jgi:hypothetical protein
LAGGHCGVEFNRLMFADEFFDSLQAIAGGLWRRSGFDQRGKKSG